MSDYTRNIRTLLLILLIITLFGVLRALSNLLIPLVLAGMLTILNFPMVNFLERLRFPRLLITAVVALLTIIILWAVVRMLSGTVEQIIQDQNALAFQFTRRIDSALAALGTAFPWIDIDSLREELNTILSPANVGALIGRFVGVLGSFGSSTVLFLLYYLILLSGAAGFHDYITYVTGEDKSGEAGDFLELAQESISAYMGIKTVVSLATGLITGVICWAFGLRFALLWGFLAFLMNYIPSIGSLIATVLPVFMGIVQFDSFGLILALAAALGISQFVIGSVIDPMLMGSRLRLNTVSVIFGLLFWGYIWGVPGMLVSVPLMVMLRLLLERNEDFAILARVMGHADRGHRKRRPLFSRIIARHRPGGD